jgi:hypothetical protein
MKYCEQKIPKSQFSFIKGGGTDANLFRIVEGIQEKVRNRNMAHAVLFIDYSNAYNTVKRSLLYQILEDNNVLDKEEIDYLRAIHERITLQCGGEKLVTELGLLQGSPISPLLFNIYLDEIIKDFLTQNDISVTDSFLYADDIAFIIPRNKLETAIISLRQLSSKRNMMINDNKSGILWIANDRTRGQPFEAIAYIPIVKQYKYLGVDIDGKGDIKTYIAKVAKKSNFIFHKLAGMLSMLSKSSFEMRKSMWNCFIRPLFEYVMPIIDFQSLGTKGAFVRLLKTSFKKFMGMKKSLDDSIIIAFFDARYIEEKKE